MRHIWAGAAIGLVVFTALSVTLSLAVLLERLIGPQMVIILVIIAITAGAATAYADYYTERR